MASSRSCVLLDRPTGLGEGRGWVTLSLSDSFLPSSVTREVTKRQIYEGCLDISS